MSQSSSSKLDLPLPSFDRRTTRIGYFSTDDRNQHVYVPSKKHEGDAGFDIYVSRDTWIWPLGFADVHTDIKIALPPGVWGRIVGRSSSVRKRHLLVVEGIIDNGYRGELFFGVLNLRPWPVLLREGERLAQLLLHQEMPTVWKHLDVLPPSDRGTNGFGSTGR